MKQRERIIICNVTPEIDGGRYAIKRIVGEQVTVEADIFAAGVNTLSAIVMYKTESDSDWLEVAMDRKHDDRWQATLTLDQVGMVQYKIKAWINPFLTWKRTIEVKQAAGVSVDQELKLGMELYNQAIAEQPANLATELQSLRARLPQPRSNEELLSNEWVPFMTVVSRGVFPTIYPLDDRKSLSVIVDRERAVFGTWYELFPRSCPNKINEHGTFNDVARFIPRLAEHGFDVLYLTPIHPIGTTNRKGKNNALQAEQSDVGSPWAIGSSDGGHKAVHPKLGTVQDYKQLVATTREYGMELAFDLALHCSPDHPYVTEHPEWFKQLPDGTIQFAENPPKKYQDIYPFDFECDEWEALWNELKSIVEFWVEQGVNLFRVDNPHTKSFAFWEWLIADIKKKHPNVLFLSEAFSRPNVMHQLTKLGFTQSYSYFAWKESKQELMDYFLDINTPSVKEYFRTNLWPNTPDILTEYLQTGGEPAFKVRVVLAGTLGASYGIYGPAYESLVNRPRSVGSEEYASSEKYQLIDWTIESDTAISHLISKLNSIRHHHAALQRDGYLAFHEVKNDHIICYSKRTANYSDQVITVVNLDPHNTQSGWVNISPEVLNIPSVASYLVYDELTGETYEWKSGWNYVELSPDMPAHIFRVAS